MAARRKPSLTPEEARRLHEAALVIDAQQPPVIGGFLFTETMRATLAEYHRRGFTREEVMPIMADLAVRELQTSPAARQTYLEFWRASGVTVACGTFSGSHKLSDAFEVAVKRIAQAYGVVEALGGALRVCRTAADIEAAHRDGVHGLVLDFQNTTPFGDALERIELFANLGVRMVQLTYNLQNLVGDGCTEAYGGGLTYFGREVVQRLNAHRILVDVSHCSEQVAWDALQVSSAPVIVSHASSKAVCYHDRGKSDELARAIADRGGFFGVVVIPGFLAAQPEPTLDVFCDHVEHLVDVMGIDHVGIGTDKAGPGPGTDSMVVYPPDMPLRRPDAFNWAGFRDAEHRLTPNFRLRGFEKFSDWPNLTVALAQRGFTEDELRKLLGLNFLRVFRDVCG
jgi:membrane dipeptidase